jgi:hypothetical protein
MNPQTPVEFKLQVSGIDATEEEVDMMTRQLLAELRDLDVESARLEKGSPAPAGSKGDPITIGAIAVEVLPAAIPALVKFIHAWMARGRGRTVKFKGMGIEFEGSTEEFEKIIALLESGRKRR